MTVVKVSRTPSIGLWFVHDKFKARTHMVEEYELPKAVVKLFNDAPPESMERFKQYFDDAIWTNEGWDLSHVKPVTRRLIW